MNAIIMVSTELDRYIFFFFYFTHFSYALTTISIICDLYRDGKFYFRGDQITWVKPPIDPKQVIDKSYLLKDALSTDRH